MLQDILRLPSASLLPLLLFSAFMTAEAHVSKTVDNYEIELGWLNEPAYVEELNAVALRVRNLETGEPVLGVAESLRVEVIYGGRSMVLGFVPSLEEGLYYAEFIPTRRGTYTFRIFGEINGVPIDEEFESGPETFDNVISRRGLQFPEPLPEMAEIDEALSSIRESIDRAMLIGISGVVIGILGVITGMIALRRGSKPAR